MKEQLKTKFNNKDLLKEICDMYGYYLQIKDNKIFCIIDGADIEDEETYTYNSFEEGLIDWLPTLEESEKEYRKNNEDITWADEISYISSLKSEPTKIEFSSKFKDYLTYGKVPMFLEEKLTSFIQKQESSLDKKINCLKSMGCGIITSKTKLPVEFIVINNELKYIKVAHEGFFNKLIFDKDTSEIEFNEQYVYDKNGLVKIMPLIPINEVQKFELNIPIVISLISNCKSKIETPINYKDLF